MSKIGHVLQEKAVEPMVIRREKGGKTSHRPKPVETGMHDTTLASSSSVASGSNTRSTT
jgi:hypothetical protein